MTEPRKLSPRLVLRFGPWSVPAKIDLLYRDGRVVPLEPRAVCVLRWLAMHAGRVVAKDELLDAVWPGAFVTEGVLKKAISQIRRALADPVREGRFIATHHRRGYRFLVAVACEEARPRADHRTVTDP